MNYEETIKAVEGIEIKPLGPGRSYKRISEECRKTALRFLRTYKEIVKDACCVRVYYNGSLRIVYELKEIIRIELWFFSDYSLGIKSYILPDGDAIGHFDLTMIKAESPIVMFLEALLADRFDYEHTVPYFKEKQEYILKQRQSPDIYYNKH